MLQRTHPRKTNHFNFRISPRYLSLLEKRAAVLANQLHVLSSLLSLVLSLSLSLSLSLCLSRSLSFSLTLSLSISEEKRARLRVTHGEGSPGINGFINEKSKATSAVETHTGARATKAGSEIKKNARAEKRRRWKKIWMGRGGFFFLFPKCEEERSMREALNEQWR